MLLKIRTVPGAHLVRIRKPAVLRNTELPTSDFVVTLDTSIGVQSYPVSNTNRSRVMRVCNDHDSRTGARQSSGPARASRQVIVFGVFLTSIPVRENLILIA
jgi:hypothetical protein